MKQNDKSSLKVIGLTGGVGGGKSMVTRILASEYGAHVIECDALGHEVLLSDGPAYGPVLELLGEGILNEQGEIDRSVVAGLVFRDEMLLKRMNEIIHPAVIEETERQIREKRLCGNCLYVVLETALMFESGLDRLCDQIWYVYASEENRRERLKESRGYSEERIKAVLDRQKSEAEFRAAADVVIDNSGSKEETKRQVAEAVRLLQET